MRFADSALVTLLIFPALCHPAGRPFVAVPEKLLEAPLAHTNLVILLSSCTPCNSTLVDTVAFNAARRGRLTATIVANEFAPHALDVFSKRYRTPALRFINDSDGRLFREAGEPVLPFLIIFDDRKRILRADVIPLSPDAQLHQLDGLDALDTIGD